MLNLASDLCCFVVFVFQGEPGIPGQSGTPGKEGLIGPKVSAAHSNWPLRESAQCCNRLLSFRRDVFTGRVSHAVLCLQGDRGFDGQQGHKGQQGEKGERVSDTPALFLIHFRIVLGVFFFFFNFACDNLE